MFRSVKSQIVFATSVIIILILGATAYFVIDQKIKEINSDIFVRAASFAELTNERVVNNYEKNYLEQAYANFDREMADIYRLDEDVLGLAIINYKGENLYIAPAIQAHHMNLNEEDLERAQAVYPSVKISGSGRIVYLEKTETGTRYTDSNGREVQPIQNTEQVDDIYYPFRDPNNALRSYAIHYHLSYESLVSRIKETASNIIVVAIFGIVIALFIGGIVAGRITSPIKKLSEGAKKIGAGELKTRIEVKTKSEVGMLADTFNKMAQDLEISTKAMIEKEKMSLELKLAGEIQRELLPKGVPEYPGIDIAASLSSAEDVGGDCFDFIGLDKNNLLFYVADVTGHGVPAGLVSAINNALVPAFLEHYTNTQDLIVHLNKILKEKTRPNVFMTMVMAHWHADENKLGYTQAGHDPIVFYDAEKQTVEQLLSGGMALGMISDISKIVKTEHVFMKPNDVAILYTDGIPEAWMSDTENYGMERFKASVRKNSILPTAKEIHDGIIADVRAFMGDFPQADDITLIVAKRTA
jgi:HAMP domain-containing protein